MQPTKWNHVAFLSKNEMTLWTNLEIAPRVNIRDKF